MNKQMLKILVFTFFFISGFCWNIYSDNPLDLDHDGMPDSWETTYGLNPSINDADNDADNDSLSNINEFRNNSYPNTQDSDNDGLLDGEEAIHFGSEFQINSYTLGSQHHPKVASNGTNYFVTWIDDSRDGNDSGIFGQLLDLNGDEIGSEFQINSYTTGEQSGQFIASNGTNYFLAWQSSGQDGSYRGIYGQLYNLNGAKIGSEFKVNTHTSNYQELPFIASNGSNYFVTWRSKEQDGDGYGIYGQLYDLNGTKIDSEFRINSYTSNDQRYQSIASVDNYYLVTWSSNGQDGSGYGVYGQLYNSTGAKIGSEFHISTHTLNNQSNFL